MDLELQTSPYHQKCTNVFAKSILTSLRRNRLHQLSLVSAEIGSSDDTGWLAFLEALQLNNTLVSLIVKNPFGLPYRLQELLQSICVGEKQVERIYFERTRICLSRNPSPEDAEFLLSAIENHSVNTEITSDLRSATANLKRRVASYKFFEHLKICCEQHSNALQEVSFVSCALNTASCRAIIRCIQDMGNIHVLDLGNNANGENWGNTCSSEGIQHILHELRYVNLTKLCLPAPIEMEIDALNELEEFLCKSKTIRELHLGPILSKDTISRLRDALSSVSSPNLSLINITKTISNLSELTLYLARNKYVTLAVDNFDALWDIEPDIQNWEAEEWRRMHKIVILIDQAIAVGCDDQASIFKLFGESYTLFPHIYMHLGRIGAAYSCLQSVKSEATKMKFISEMLIKMKDGPFFNSGYKKIMGILVLLLTTVPKRTKWFAESEKAKSVKIFIDKFFTDYQFKQDFQILLEKFDCTMENTVRQVLDNAVCGYLSEQSSDEEIFQMKQLTAEYSFAEIHDWVIENLANEMTFRSILGHCQDYRYGDTSIEEPVDTFTGELIKAILNRNYLNVFRKLWVIEHLVLATLYNEVAYKRRSDIYLLNYNGIGIPLRKDKVRLSETQRGHYCLLKKVGATFIDEWVSKNTLSDDEKIFIEKKLLFPGLNLSHYEITQKTETNTQQVIAQTIKHGTVTHSNITPEIQTHIEN